MFRRKGTPSIEFSLKDLLMMETCFYSEDAEDYLEPAPPWRQFRVWSNIIWIVMALWSVFQPLEGTMFSFLRMLLFLGVTFLLFLATNVFILMRAPLLPVRPELHPDYLAETKRRLDEGDDGDRT